MRTEKTRLLRSGEVAKRLGLHPLTVRRWVKEGKISAIPIGREARIPITEVERLLGEQRAGLIVLYARVSGHDQKKTCSVKSSSLNSGRWWPDRAEDEDALGHWLGPQYRAQKPSAFACPRPGLPGGRSGRDLLRSPDPLWTFLPATLFSGYGVTLTVLDPDDEKTPEQELTDDLLALIASFAGRLYGLRSRKQKALLSCARQVLAEQEG